MTNSAEEALQSGEHAEEQVEKLLDERAELQDEAVEAESIDEEDRPTHAS